MLIKDGRGLPAHVGEDAPPKDSLPNANSVVGLSVIVLVELGVCTSLGS